jgi:hypothetical protein
MTGLRFTISAAMVSVAMFALVEPAAAEAACVQLEAELASVASGQDNSSLVRTYDGAISTQLDQIEIARAQASDAGCGFGAEARRCATLESTVKQMGGNLAALERERKRIAGSTKRSKSELLAALDANGCSREAINGLPAGTGDARDAVMLAPGPLEPAEPEITIIGIEPETETDGPHQNPLSRMLDAAERGETPEGFFSDPPRQTYRTMCVRACDGYFYPMSYAVTASEFERDEKRCEASCPGVTMELYYGETGVDDAARMQSTKSSKFYADLPAAFLHQKVNAKKPEGCVCNARKGFDVVAGKPPRGEDEPNILGEISQPRANGTEEIEEPTVQPNARSTSIVEVPLPGTKEPEALPADTVIDVPPAKDRKIRVVGPGFLPDRNEAIDLQGPAQPTAR